MTFYCTATPDKEFLLLLNAADKRPVIGTSLKGNIWLAKSQIDDMIYYLIPSCLPVTSFILKSLTKDGYTEMAESSVAGKSLHFL